MRNMIADATKTAMMAVLVLDATKRALFFLNLLIISTMYINDDVLEMCNSLVCLICSFHSARRTYCVLSTGT